MPELDADGLQASFRGDFVVVLKPTDRLPDGNPFTGHPGRLVVDRKVQHPLRCAAKERHSQARIRRFGTEPGDKVAESASHRHDLVGHGAAGIDDENHVDIHGS
jgi:hypothetical protein